MPHPDDNELSFLQRAAWLQQRRPHKIEYPLAASQGTSPKDIAIAARIMTAYRRAMDVFQPTESFWDQSFFAVKREVHDAVMSESIDTIEAMLLNPGETSLFWGFDGPTKPPSGTWGDDRTAPRDPHAFVLRNANAQTDWHALYGVWLMDSLFSVGEAMGVLRADYPEISTDMPRQYPEGLSADEIIDLIDKKLDLILQFPSPFPGELGLSTRRGVVSFRAIQALYQAWRIWTIADGEKDFNVLEIGAGLGRTAYFAKILGLNNYTIIDIPMTNIAQANFLIRALNSNDIAVFGELKKSINIYPSFSLKSIDQKFDLIVNVDSFTEMSIDSMNEYYQFSRKTFTPILSINHEYNENTFFSISHEDPMAKTIRYPYWPRRGYVEEIVNWRKA